MKVETKTTLTVPRTEEGYRLAKEWCDRRKRQGIRNSMIETETTIILEEQCVITVDSEVEE